MCSKRALPSPSKFGAFVVATTVLGSYFAHAETPVTIRNQCSHSIDVWDNKESVPLAPGDSFVRVLPPGFHGMFRAGKDPQATLAEFSTDGGMLWYDISIIPTGPKGGPGYCPSLDACKQATGGVGFNVPMQISPQGCKTLTCLSDGCADAYQYPKDDTKTNSCHNLYTNVDLVFCPGGSGGGKGSNPAPSPQLAPAPSATGRSTPTSVPSSPIPNTPTPTTQAPQSSNTTLVDDHSNAGDSIVTKPSENATPESIAPPVQVPVETVKQNDGKVEIANTQAKSSASGGSVVTVLSVMAGILACVAAAVVVVVHRKRKQLEELEPKDSYIQLETVCTPSQGICLL